LEYIVFQIDGGAGKNIVATAVVRSINNKWPDKKIVILTAHPEIWFCNPRVYRVLQTGNAPYFYDDYIKGKDTLIFSQEPYRQSDCIYRKKHLSQVWCEMYNIDWSGETPELYFTNLEKEFIATLIKKDRPILVMQPFGGAQNKPYSWARDIPPSLAQTIVDQFRNEYKILQVKREDQILLNGVEPITGSQRMLAMTLLFSDKRILIDSIMQHAAAALGLPSYVFWIGNSPVTFGYQIHKNIVTDFEMGTLRHSLYDPFDISGDPIQLMTPPDQLFDTKTIIDYLKEVPQSLPEIPTQAVEAPAPKESKKKK
jgi:hypothetical protein